MGTEANLLGNHESCVYRARPYMLNFEDETERHIIRSVLGPTWYQVSTGSEDHTVPGRLYTFTVLVRRP